MNATTPASKLDHILAAYVTAALWSEPDTDDDGHGDTLDALYGPADLATSATLACRRDVESFVTLVTNLRPGCLDDLDPSQVGHDFLLTRNGHGAGFWDRGLGERGDFLTVWAHTFGDASFYAGDDGLIYVAGDETYGEVSA